MPFAPVNGIDIYFETYGEGEPIVFIHGVAVTSRVWDFQKEGISREFKMIIYDLRGSGKSGKTPGINHTAELLCEDLKGLLDYLGIRYTNIVGISLGSAVAMKFAINYPDRVRCLVMTGAFADLKGVLSISNRFFGHIIGRLLMTRFFGGIITKLMLPSASREELLYYHKYIVSIDWDEILKYNQILRSYKITSALGRITSPTLMLYGSHEQVIYKYGFMIKEKISKSKMQIIPGVGHGWNGEKPELFNSMVIGFIRQNSK